MIDLNFNLKKISLNYYTIKNLITIAMGYRDRGHCDGLIAKHFPREQTCPAHEGHLVLKHGSTHF